MRYGLIWTREVHLRDPSPGKIHLVHIGSQHVEVQREGQLRQGASTVYSPLE